MSTTSRAPARKDTREMAMGIPTAAPVLRIVRPVSMPEDNKQLKLLQVLKVLNSLVPRPLFNSQEETLTGCWNDGLCTGFKFPLLQSLCFCDTMQQVVTHQMVRFDGLFDCLLGGLLKNLLNGLLDGLFDGLFEGTSHWFQHQGMPKSYLFSKL